MKKHRLLALLSGKKAKSIKAALLLAFLPVLCFSQNWAKVGNGFNEKVIRLTVDTSENVLYAFGEFDSTAEGIPVHYAAQYTGGTWDSIPFLHNYYPGINIIKYNNKYIFGMSILLSWDGAKTDTIAKFDYGGASGFMLYKNKLLIYGGFGKINGVVASSIATWDGINWSALDTTVWHGIISTAKEYQGNLYIGGQMYSDSIEDFAYWDGIRWHGIGQGVTGVITSGIADMEIYNNDLYISGVFNNLGNCVARWDGSNWKDAGVGFTSLNAGIYDLQVFNGELYACGQFSRTGTLPIKGIAKWNGTKWCGLGQTTTTSYQMTCMAVHNNELYVGGHFLTIDGDTVNYIAKWIGGNFTDTCTIETDVNDLSVNKDVLSIYPTPFTTDLSITLQQQNPQQATITITNAIGQPLYTRTEDNLSHTYTKMLELSYLPNGIYFVAVEFADGERVVKRVVKNGG